MRLKHKYDYRPVSIIYTVEEAVTKAVNHDYGAYSGQIETLEQRVNALTEIVARLVAGKKLEEIIPSFEQATEGDIKAYQLYRERVGK